MDPLPSRGSEPLEVPQQGEAPMEQQDGVTPACSSSGGTTQHPEEVSGVGEPQAGERQSLEPAGESPTSSNSPEGGTEEKPPPEGEGSPGGIPALHPPCGALASAAEPPQGWVPQRDEDLYCVKWISWKGERTPVITQSENGPCPLLAIINILLLQWKVKLPPQKEVITAEELMAHLGDCILATQPREPSEGLQLNFQQNISDTMMVLPKLSTGLDVNVRFTGVSDFEYTPECIIFDLLNVPLYHGWLVEPQSPEVVQAVGKLSYNQLVEKIITCKQASDSSLVSEGLVAEQFLESTASQLTYHGLCELTSKVQEGQLSVFFRNNHFSTMIKHKGHLYLLVTDQGFLQEERVVWESLHTVDGDSCFCDAEFHLSQPGSQPRGPQEQDYLMSDLELARQLQQEEYQHLQPQPHPNPNPQPRPSLAQARGRERRQRQRPDLDCALL